MRAERECVEYVPDDRPTPEVQARRVAMFGKPAPEDGAPQGELECVISVLGRKLDADQRSAASLALSVYGRYTMVILPPRVVSGQLQDYVQGAGAGPAVADDLDEHKQAYELLRRAVLREVRYRFQVSYGDPSKPHAASIARKAWRAVQSIMHREMPRDLRALRLGLDAIVRAYDLSDAPVVRAQEKTRAAA